MIREAISKQSLAELESHPWFHTPTEMVEDGATVLYYASGCNRTDIVERQLQLGAIPDQRMEGKHKSIALHAAAYRKCTDAAIKLVEAVSSEIASTNIINDCGESPLENACCSKIPRNAVRRSVDPILTVLTLKGCNIATFEHLIKRWSQIPKCVFPGSEETLLHLAVKAENYEICIKLLETPVTATFKCKLGRTPLAVALINECSHTGIIVSLMQHMSCDDIDEAIRSANLQSEINKPFGSQNKCTILYLAAKGKKEVVEMLHKKYGADLDAQCSAWKSSPLNMAAHLGSYEVVEYLASAGANCNAENASGKTPFDELQSLQDIDSIPTFLKEVIPTNITTALFEKMTSTELSVLADKFIISGNSACTILIIKILISRGEDVNLLIAAAVVRSPDVLTVIVKSDICTAEVFVTALESADMLSPSQICGKLSLYQALTIADGSYLKLFLQRCYSFSEVELINNSQIETDIEEESA